MKRTIHYLQSIFTAVAILASTTTASYGANLSNVGNSTFAEQFDVLNLNNSTPDPLTILLLGIGLLLLAAVAKRGKTKS